jgi:hypothetical protein
MEDTEEVFLVLLFLVAEEVVLEALGLQDQPKMK